ncbi:MAG: hypothetical protein ACK52I_30935 [Pseudomonadota bacterium]
MALNKEKRNAYYNKLLKESLKRHAHNIKSKEPILEKKEKIINWNTLLNFIKNKNESTSI